MADLILTWSWGGGGGGWGIVLVVFIKDTHTENRTYMELHVHVGSISTASRVQSTFLPDKREREGARAPFPKSSG